MDQSWPIEEEGAAPIENHASQPAAMAHLLDENARLRAALADLRARISGLEVESGIDPATGIVGASAFEAALSRAIANVERHQMAATMLLVEVEGLGEISAAQGEEAGRLAEAHVAALLDRLIRATDVAGRLGGGAFGLILERLDRDSAIETGERLKSCIREQPVEIAGRKIALGPGSRCPGSSAAIRPRR
ncbi:MAG: GGDEF domain-containing protein [Sphingomonadaceae bacterium]